MASGSFLHASFGSAWRSDIALPQFDTWSASEDAPLSQAIEVRAVGSCADRVPLRTINRGHVYADGLRFQWQDEVTFDLSDGARLDYLPGPGWTGVMPAAFYGTVAALTLAWRGDLPFHASAVEIGGKAMLIAGAPGAGKSTLAAALLDRGARLIGDDLTVIEPVSAAAPVIARRGRPTIRLHHDTALKLAAEDRHAVPGDARGKWLVRPHGRCTLSRIPLAGVLLLGYPDEPAPAHAAAATLAEQLFRPRWLAALPGHAARLQTVAAIAERVPLHGFATSDGFHADGDAVDRVYRRIEVMVGSRS